MSKNVSFSGQLAHSVLFTRTSAPSEVSSAPVVTEEDIGMLERIPGPQYTRNQRPPAKVETRNERKQRKKLERESCV